METQNQNIPLSSPPAEPPKTNWFLKHTVLYSVIGVLLLVVIVGSVYWWKEIKQTNQIQQNPEIFYSVEYKQYVESIEKINDQWLVMKSQMEKEGTNQKDIELAKKDYIEFVGSTIFLKIQFESSLSDAEKKAILNKLQKLALDNSITLSTDGGCAYTEQELPLQDFFIGATLKFKKPMAYIDWKEEKTKECSPKLSSTKFFLYSVEKWNNIILDKSKIIEYPIDSSTTFMVEERIKLHRGGLFTEDSEYYVLRDSGGVITVSPPYIFDADYRGEIGYSGSELYRGDKYIGHVVSNINDDSVWIQGTQAPIK